MWFSIAELNEFYSCLQLGPASPELGPRIRILRKNIDDQPAGFRYLLDNIEIHTARMLAALQSLRTSSTANSLSSLLSSKALSSLSNILGGAEHKPEQKDFESIVENLRLALPLCRDTWFDKKKVEVLIAQYLSNNQESNKKLGDLLNLEKQHNFLSLYSSIEKKERQEKDKRTKFSSTKIAAAHLVANVVVEERLADDWYQILPFCHYVQKYIETENSYYLSRTQGALQFFADQLFKYELPDDIIQSTLGVLASELQTKNKITQHKQITLEITSLNSFLVQQPIVLDYIKSQMVRNSVLGSLVYEFVQMIRMYQRTPKVKQSIVTAIERDITSLLREFSKAYDEYDLSLEFVDEYMTSLKSFYQYTATEKLNHHQLYLTRFIMQGIDVFYQLMLTDVLCKPLGDHHIPLDELIRNYLKNHANETKKQN